MNIFLIAMLILIGLATWIGFTIFGIQLCLNDNATGLILLFLSLNILGIVIGISIMYNNNIKKQKEKSEKHEQRTIRSKN